MLNTIGTNSLNNNIGRGTAELRRVEDDTNQFNESLHWHPVKRESAQITQTCKEHG